jgi:hypothetical protein
MSKIYHELYFYRSKDGKNCSPPGRCADGQARTCRPVRGLEIDVFEAINWPADMTPSRSPIHFTNELEVEASPETIWSLLVDPTAWPAFYPGVEHVLKGCHLWTEETMQGSFWIELAKNAPDGFWRTHEKLLAALAMVATEPGGSRIAAQPA